MMIRRFLVAGWLALAVVCHAVAAGSAINPSLHLLGRAQFCYAGLFPVYEANYYLLPGSEEGQAEGRCLQLSYKRAINQRLSIGRGYVEDLRRAAWCGGDSEIPG